MEAFRWTPSFLTGLSEVDAQHHRLVDLINRFGDLIMRNEGVASVEIEQVFGELADYARYHFVEEESLMEAVPLDARHIEQHRHAHQSFLSDIKLLHENVTADSPDAARALLQFLTHWLAYHILGSDQIMARQMASIKAGCSAADAYVADTPARDPATETLLTALNGLFHHVSDRNRELVELNTTLEHRVAERTLALRDANRRLEELAHTDTLTGLANRRSAMRHLALEWQAAVDHGLPLACMMIDADGFKAVNDRHGHDAGDAVLRALASQLRYAVRTDDVVFRLGGDEFLIICRRTDHSGATTLAESIRKAVSALRIPLGAAFWQASVSIGVAVRTPAMTDIEALIKAADLGVYAAKRQGRNCVASAAA